MSFQEYYDKYSKQGFLPIKCRGYNPKFDSTTRKNAKIPVAKGWTDSNYPGVSLEECEKWIEAKGWIGWRIPKGYIALDIDKDETHTKQIDDYINHHRLNVAVHITKNGKHYMFKAPEEEISVASLTNLRIGIPQATYRVANQQLILCPMEPERIWEKWFDNFHDLAVLPEVLLPLDLTNKAQLLHAIALQIKFYHNMGVINGYDIDMSFGGLLIDKIDLREAEFQDMYQTIFGDKHDEARTTKAYEQAVKKENKQTTGTFVKILKESKLDHIIYLINMLKHPDDPTSVAKIVQFFNKEHSVIDINGKVAVMKEFTKASMKRKTLKFYAYPDFKKKYSTLPPFVTQKGDKVAYMAQTDVWLGSPKRRQYEDIDYIPGKKDNNDVYNLWQGFSCDPIKGDCSKYLKHIEDNIASGNQVIYEYLIHWMADAVQNLRVKDGVAIVLRGAQGVGKGVFITQFGKIFGSHFLPISNSRSLVGNFNSVLLGISLVFADEAFWGGDKQSAGVLKSLVSEDTLRIEYKGKDAITVRNYLRLMMASNNEWVVPAGPEERRFCVIDVSQNKMQQRDYFQDIIKEMNSGGREALLYYLLNIDLTDVDIAKFPKTDALMDQKLRELNSIDRYWFHCLFNGSIAGLDSWPDWISKVTLYEEYVAFCKHMGLKYIETNTYFARRLRVYVNLKNKIKGRDRGYLLPSFAECRETFKKHISADDAIFDESADSVKFEKQEEF